MGAALADITKEAGEVFARLMVHVSDELLSPDDVLAVRRLVEVAELVCTRAVSRLAESTCFPELGHRDVGAWLAAEAGARRSEGHARCEQARLLDDFLLIRDAVSAGRFSQSHLRCLAGVLTAKRLVLARRDEQVFVDAAAMLDASLFARLVQRWAALADDELCDPAEPGRGDDAGFAGRRLQLSRLLNGSWRLSGLLDPVAGEAVEAALVAVMGKLSPGETRTPVQRRADALSDVCQSFLANADRPVVGNERPNVNVVFHAADGSAHTTGGWFLRNWQLSQVLCDATITAAAATMNGVVFDVGTPVSAIPVRNRKAVVIRDRCCRFGFCSQGLRFAEVHHIVERENGGTHEVINLVLLCTHHHREVHRRGIKLSWDGATLVATFPNGVMVHGPPHPNTFPSLF
jgi:Domain of unknown function (DUF222)/HNH endonuclease